MTVCDSTASLSRGLLLGAVLASASLACGVTSLALAESAASADAPRRESASAAAVGAKAAPRVPAVSAPRPRAAASAPAPAEVSLPARVRLSRDADAGSTLVFALPRPAPFEIEMGPAQVVVRWQAEGPLLALEDLPTAAQLAGTAVSRIEFAADDRNTLIVHHRPDFGIALSAGLQHADAPSGLTVRFRPPAVVADRAGAVNARVSTPAPVAAVAALPAAAPLLPQVSNKTPVAAGSRSRSAAVGAAAVDPAPIVGGGPDAGGAGGAGVPAVAGGAEAAGRVDDAGRSDVAGGAYGAGGVDAAGNVAAIDGMPAAGRAEAARAADAHAVPVPRPEDFVAAVPVPDRWRILQALGPPGKWYDPYNQNTLKGDRPVHDDWFFNVTATSDTFFESRRVPTPVGLQTSAKPGSNDVFGNYDQSALVQNVALELVYYQGNTVFKPVDWEFRFTPVFNVNYTRLEEILGVDAVPSEGDERRKTDVGIQSAFVDKHLWNVSDNYDFDSVRVGIQPFSSDFRGFLFQDAPFGVRLFGNRLNNRIQYNVAWFRRIDKDVNSGLNDLRAGLRDDDVFIANLYWQDMPRLGFFSEFLIAYNRNRETDNTFDDNNFITRPASIGLERPRTYDVFYLGLGGDGHFGRLNLTTQAYWVVGEEQGGVFTGYDSDVDGLFLAAESSVDFDWLRLRGSLLYASGDRDPYDDRSEAFDAIFENPIFAGADTSYWIRQAVPLIGGGRVTLSGRNGLLNSLRSSKEQGQSNFTNPGLILAGIGADADVLPQLRLSLNANHLRFADTSVLEVARATTDLDDEIGFDVSASLIWRPFMTQNIVVRLSYAVLLPGDGYQDLYGDDTAHSLLANVVFNW